MKSYNMPLYERETHITYNAEYNSAVIDTFDTLQIRKLDKLVEECPDSYTLLGKDDYLGNVRARYQVADKKLIAFKKPYTRTLTDEQREAARERMRSIRNSMMHNS